MIKFINDLENYKPKDEYSRFVKEYFKDIIKFGTKKFIANLDVEIKIIEINGKIIPVSIDNENSKNCYVSSVLGMLEYLEWESKLVENKFLKYIIEKLARISKSFTIKNKLYKNIYVNNFLLSTNLYPEIKKEEIYEIVDFLKQNYEDYAIIFRSINDFDRNFLDFFKDFGKIITRQIFISKSENKKDYLKIRDVKNDKNIFIKNGYNLGENKKYNDFELDEILKCYNDLYIKKYIYLNPQITKDFLKNVNKNNLFNLNTLEKNGKINAVFGYFYINNQITTPIFGYKNSFGEKEGLYRQISYLLLNKTLDEAKILNQSSGVGRFKMNRGAQMSLEFMMIYYKHLNLKKRIFWNILVFFSKIIGENNLKNNIY